MCSSFNGTRNALAYAKNVLSEPNCYTFRPNIYIHGINCSLDQLLDYFGINKIQPLYVGSFTPPKLCSHGNYII